MRFIANGSSEDARRQAHRDTSLIFIKISVIGVVVWVGVLGTFNSDKMGGYPSGRSQASFPNGLVGGHNYLRAVDYWRVSTSSTMMRKTKT